MFTGAVTPAHRVRTISSFYRNSPLEAIRQDSDSDEILQRLHNAQDFHGVVTTLWTEYGNKNLQASQTPTRLGTTVPAV